MFKEKGIIFLKALTSVHAGEGSSVSFVDLPIQRETYTNFPVIRSSSVKGTIRRFFGKNNKSDLYFGPEDDKESSDFASAVVFTDARLLFFPVKSFKNIFALITCPYVLKRFSEDINIIDKSELKKPIDNILNEVKDIDDNSCFVVDTNYIVKSNNNKVVLDEYALTSNKLDLTETDLNFVDKNKIVIVSDNMFKHFISSNTEVAARTKINSETGIVKKGALWYEEYLPAESLLYSVTLATKVRKPDYTEQDNILKEISDKIGNVIQIGGNETIGKGLVQLNWIL